jgi:hypothetical protein
VRLHLALGRFDWAFACSRSRPVPRHPWRSPPGRILAQSAAELRRPQPRARRYAYADTGGGDAGDSLLCRFPSQFEAPWSFARGHDVRSGDVPATLLRLPLRVPEAGGAASGGAAAAAGGALKDYCVSEADARAALAAFASLTARGLLLARAVRRVAVAVWEAGASLPARVFECEIGHPRLSGGGSGGPKETLEGIYPGGPRGLGLGW